MRPRVALGPYSTGIPGTFICSAASPPDAGAHGMRGYTPPTPAAPPPADLALTPPS
jgi:hypothetical protein